MNWTNDQLRQTKAGAKALGVPLPAAPPPPVSHAQAVLRPSTDEAKLNKTERDYLLFIRHLGFAWIGVQNITLKLGHDCRYTPDFVTVDQSGHIQVRETKGAFFRDDAKAKLQIAARLFPWLEFLLVRRSEAGWEHTIVKP